MNEHVQIYTTVQVARILSLRPDTITRMARAGEISGFQLQGRGDWRFSQADLAQYISRQRTAKTIA